MKRYLLPLMVLCAALTAFAAPFTSNEVPADFTNDIMLNSDFVELRTGETYQITARRLPEIVETSYSEEVVLPKFTYSVIEGESVTVDADGKITAVKSGRSLIEVGYEATTAFGKDYAAISPVNMAYMVVDVLGTDIDIKTDITATSYDTYYYTTGTGYDLTFNVTAENATAVKVLLNGKEIKANDDKSYTAHLANRTNVIEVEASNASHKRRWAKTIDARRCETTVKNITNPDKPVVAGDSVEVSFRGIVFPVYKLVKFYNPHITCAMFDNEQLGTVNSNVDLSQYEFPTHNTIGFTVKEAGEYIFNNGRIKQVWWGYGPLGEEKDFINGEYPKRENPDNPAWPPLAEQMSVELSKLPAFRINVAPKIDAETHTVTTTYAKDLMAADGEPIVYNDNLVWDKTYSEDELHSTLLNDQIVAYHLPSGASYGGTSWEGFTLSKNFDNDFATGSLEKQWGNSAGRGLADAADPFLLSYFSYYCENVIADKTTHALQIDLATEPRQLLGAYVCPTAWSTNNVVIDGGFTRRFHAGDYLTITAHGLDADGNDNGKTVVYYLADFRDKSAHNWHVAQEWQWMDLRELGVVSGVYFTMESTDNGSFGPNTTCYFAMDGISTIVEKGGSTETAANTTNAEKLDIYPNPVQDFVNISAADGTTATVYNLQGQVVTTATIANRQINLSHLATGTYIVRVGNTTARIIKL